MKTGLQVAQDINSLIDLPVVTSAISGKIYQGARPLNSKLIDIAIGIQGINNEWLQEGTVNVNIYAPNLSFNSDSTRPNLPVFDRLSTILCPLLDSQYKDSFYTIVASPAVIYKDTDVSHFVNIKVDYYSIQDDFKNI